MSRPPYRESSYETVSYNNKEYSFKPRKDKMDGPASSVGDNRGRNTQPSAVYASQSRDGGVNGLHPSVGVNQGDSARPSGGMSDVRPGVISSATRGARSGVSSHGAGGTRPGTKSPGSRDPHPSSAKTHSGVFGGKNLRIVLAIIAAVLVVGVLIYAFACHGFAWDPNAKEGQAPYKTDSDMMAEASQQLQEGMFNIGIANEVQFEDGKSAGKAYIENSPSNKYNMQVTIMDASDNVVYESGVIRPNQYIEDITLSKDLGSGIYDATAVFKALDPGSLAKVGQVEADVTLEVLG